MTRHRGRPHHIDPALETVRLILIYKDFKGRGFSHEGLGVASALTAKTLRRHGIWAEVWACRSVEDVRARLNAAQQKANEHNEIPVSHVVIQAPWIPTESLASLAVAHSEIVFTELCHSNLGFLSCDGEAIQFMQETAELQYSAHNVRAAANCAAMVEFASLVWGSRLALLPNLYDMSESVPVNRPAWRGEALRVGMFGAARLLKNGITGAGAAAVMASKLRSPVELYVSRGRDEGGSLREIERVTRGVPNLTLRPVDWLPWPKFRGLMRQMHVHLQPSLTESCNLTVQDAIAEKVPSATGPAIHWVPEHWKANVDDAVDVARVAIALVHDPYAAEDGFRKLEEYVRKGLDEWKRFVLARCGEHQHQLLQAV